MYPQRGQKFNIPSHFGCLFGVLLRTFSKQFSSTFFKTLPGTILADLGAKRVPKWNPFGSMFGAFPKQVVFAFLVDPPVKIKGLCFQRVNILFALVNRTPEVPQRLF